MMHINEEPAGFGTGRALDVGSAPQLDTLSSSTTQHDAATDLGIPPAFDRRKRNPSWRDVLPVHPAADGYPRMSHKMRGLTNPIVLWSAGPSGGPRMGDDRKDPKFQL